MELNKRQDYDNNASPKDKINWTTSRRNQELFFRLMSTDVNPWPAMFLISKAKTRVLNWPLSRRWAWPWSRWPWLGLAACRWLCISKRVFSQVSMQLSATNYWSHQCLRTAISVCQMWLETERKTVDTRRIVLFKLCCNHLNHCVLKQSPWLWP